VVSARCGVPKKLTQFLEWQALPPEEREGEELPELPAEARIAQHIWNMLGGAEWAGFELACDLYGVRDPHAMALMLAAIRDAQHELSERNRR